VVLDRVPPEAMQELRVHLATMLRDRGLANSPMFTIPELDIADGFLPDRVVGPLLTWLTRLARDHRSRDVVVRRTLHGVISSLEPRIELLAAAAQDQEDADAVLRADLRSVFASGRTTMERELSDGSLLRGEVLARWQEFVGTGEFFRNVDSAVGRV